MSKIATCRHVSIWDSTKWWPIVCTYSFPLPPLPIFLLLSMLYTPTRYIHTLLCVHLLSLMCQRLLVMRFLQDGKLQGHWLTAHFKHCSLPLPFLSCGTQRMKREWEEEQKHIVSHVDTCTHAKKNSGKYVGPCGFAENHQGKQVLGVWLNIGLLRSIKKIIDGYDI